MTDPITCEFCTYTFQVKYDEDDIEDPLGFCPFCGEKIFYEDEDDVPYEDRYVGERVEIDDMDT